MGNDRAEAREAIRDLVARYNAYGDSGRFDALLELFEAGAWLEIPGPQRYEGHPALRELFMGAVRKASSGGLVERIAHHVSTLVIDFEEGEARAATGACYYTVFGEKGLDHWGRYRDTYGYDGHTWRFTSRRVSVDGRTPGGWADRNLADS